ncbi:unnamed protein product [Microthlaspi erraticum]|uniref:Integrase catalytic domain-containing protein n=1 Tax=Microthlaspi erraticum TaxID=1685480 RepID=A0A6D2HQE8_9BRAS|nr:unnamed protein product [Microthlaspi erraticum]
MSINDSPTESNETIAVSASHMVLNVNMTNVTKLNASNFLMWSLQVHVLLDGYGLAGYLDGSTTAPPSTCLLGAITINLHPLLSKTATAAEIRSTLTSTYAKPSRDHIKQLRQQLKQWSKGTKSVNEYFQGFTTRFDQLALLGKTIDHEDQIEFILEGLNDDYKSVIDQIEGRDAPPSLTEIHEKLLNHEAKLQSNASASSNIPITANAVNYKGSNRNQNKQPHRGHNNNNNWQQPPPQFAPRQAQYTPRPYLGRCQFCGVTGHSARRCPQLHQTVGPFASPPPMSAPWQPRAQLAAVPYNASNWVMDSGATHHLTTDLNNLALHQPYNGGEEVTIANGTGLNISHIGSSSLSTPTRSLMLHDVLYVPDLKRNLISVYRMYNNNKVSVEFFPTSFQVKDLRTGVRLLQGKTKDELYEWPVTNPISNFASPTSKTDTTSWHNRLGHPSLSVLQKEKIRTLYSDNGGEFIALRSFLSDNGISHFTSPPHTPEHNGIAERKHRHVVETGLTLLGQSSMPTSYWYYAFSTAVYLINRFPSPTIENHTPYEKLFQQPPNYLKLRVFGCFCFSWLRPYTSHKLDERSKPCTFIGYSLTQSAYLCLDPASGRVYMSRHVQFVETSFSFAPTPTPAEIIPDSPPQPSLLPVQFIPSPPLVTTQPIAPSSLGPHHQQTPPPSPPSNPRTTATAPSSPQATPSSPITTPQFSDNELSSRSGMGPSHNPSTSNLSPQNIPSPQNLNQSPNVSTSSSSNSHSSNNSISPSPPPSPEIPPPSPENPDPPLNLHSMQTRAKNNIIKPNRKFSLAASTRPTIPTTVNQAMRDEKWRNATTSEFNAIVKNEIFSPVIKSTTVRAVLDPAVSNSWPIRQLDVNNAFLQGTFTDEVYVTQPPGFVDPDRPDYVCKLNKALYGLKQAPRAWYEELKASLIAAGFRNSVADTSLFTYHHGMDVVYILVYVDDIVVTGNSDAIVNTMISALANRFSLKDHGPLSYFLGIEATRTAAGLHLMQRKYVIDLLTKTKMLDATPVSTPMATHPKLSLNSGMVLQNPSEYRMVVGSLQYLAFTRPDVAFAVNKLSQFMHAPTDEHWKAAKRVLRYLAGTTSHGIFFRANSPLTLHAYSDADWAGDVDDYVSTNAYIVYLGTTPISWSSKKQRGVARSSTEAEYRAVANTAAELRWVCSLLSELGITLPSPPSIYCDNVGATYLSANPVFHSRMKHLALDFHFVRDNVQSGAMRVTHVSTKDQLADALTKPLSRARFHELYSKIGVSKAPPSCGGV